MSVDISDPSGSQLLIELIKGQQAAATELRLQNARLFGGDGQPGAIKILLDQHNALTARLDENKDELLNKISTAKDDLLDKMENQKKETDQSIKEVKEAQQETDKKVSRVITIGAMVNTLFLGAMAFLGVYHRSK